MFSLKIASAYWVLSLICFYGAWEGIKGLKKIGRPILRYIVALCLLFVTFFSGYISFNITIDFFKFDYNSKIIVVSDIDKNPGPKGGILYTEVYGEEKEPYCNMLKTFKFIEGKTYEIKYLPRTRAIIEARLKE